MNRTIFVHAHIFKNAGSTFESSLNNSLGNQFTIIRKNPELWKSPAVMNDIIRLNPKLTAVSAHWVNLTHMKKWDFDTFPFLILRHPLERVKSVYNFEKKQVKDASRSALIAKNLTFKEYVEWSLGDPRHFVIQNHQTRYCTGTHRQDIGEQQYAKAVDLLNVMPVVGCVEFYDETMVLLEQELAKRGLNFDLSYVRRNVTQSKHLSIEDKLASSQQELGTLYDTLESENHYDKALYQLARQRLLGQIEAQSNFETKLEAFRQRCQDLGAAPLKPVAQLTGKLSLKLRTRRYLKKYNPFRS